MNTDKNGREYLKLYQLKTGDVIELDEGFTCCSGKVTIQEDVEGLFFECDAGKHYLDGQLEDDHLIGVYKL